MENDEKTKSLQVGEATEEKSPVAAIIEINGMIGSEKYFFEGNNAVCIIDEIEQYQDLGCLCSMAPVMGTKEDAKIANDLDVFVSGDYTIEDFDKFDFPFSIGSLKCLGWAKGEKNCALLKAMHESDS